MSTNWFNIRVLVAILFVFYLWFRRETKQLKLEDRLKLEENVTVEDKKEIKIKILVQEKLNTKEVANLEETLNVENSTNAEEIVNVEGHSKNDYSKSRVQELSEFGEFSTDNLYDCVPMSVAEISHLICIKDPNIDEVISGGIHRYGVWEEGILQSVIRVMSKLPQSTFLDLGSNIGVYSTSVLAMGRDVVAVDAMYDNLALIKESHKRNGKGRLWLIYNSISDHYETLYPYNDDPKNPGGINLLTAEQLDAGGSDNWHQSPIDKSKIAGPPVESVTTIDILNYINASVVVLKIDVEGFECQALPSSVLDQSTGVYIPYIFVEWRLIVANIANRCPDYRLLEKRLYQHGYNPRNTRKIQQLILSDSSMWTDVVWVHKNENIKDRKKGKRRKIVKIMKGSENIKTKENQEKKRKN